MSISDGFSGTDLSVRRGALAILEGAELAAAPGQIVALTGPNGSGKTSLLEGLAGLLPLARGRIELAGARLEHLPANRRARAGMRLVRDRGMLFADLTVAENLAIVQNCGRFIAPPKIDAFPLIGQRLRQRAGSLSGGERRIVAIVAALLAGPLLLLVDEFSEGLHATAIPGVLAAIRGCCAQGMVAILVVHSPPLIEREEMIRVDIEGRRLRLFKQVGGEARLGEMSHPPQTPRHL